MLICWSLRLTWSQRQRQHSPPTAAAQVRFVCCWFSTLLREYFSRFPSLHKNIKSSIYFYFYFTYLFIFWSYFAGAYNWSAPNVSGFIVQLVGASHRNHEVTGSYPSVQNFFKSLFAVVWASFHFWGNNFIIQILTAGVNYRAHCCRKYCELAIIHRLPISIKNGNHLVFLF